MSLRVGSGMGKETGSRDRVLFGGVAPAFDTRFGVSVDVGPYTVPNTTVGESGSHRTIETNNGTDPWASSQGCEVLVLGVPVENEKAETVHTTFMRDG